MLVWTRLCRQCHVESSNTILPQLQDGMSLTLLFILTKFHVFPWCIFMSLIFFLLYAKMKSYLDPFFHLMRLHWICQKYPFLTQCYWIRTLFFIFGNGLIYYHNPANTKHLYNICTMLDQRWRRWADVVQMLYKCFVFAGNTQIKGAFYNREYSHI